MNSKSNKVENRNASRARSIRINLENQKKAKKLLNLANSKKAGRKVKFDQLLDLALELVKEEHIKILQTQTLKNEDRQEILRQKYIEMYGQISKDEFIGFTMTPAYVEFLNAQVFSQLPAEAV